MDRWLSHQLALFCLLSMLIPSCLASFKFTDIQLIVGFSSACTSAYDKSVSDCSLKDLRGIGGSGTCDSDCKSSIQSAESSIQSACSRESADQNSLIGKLFVGDGVDFLCGDDSATTTTTTITSFQMTYTASSMVATSSVSTPATTTAQSDTTSSTAESGSSTSKTSSFSTSFTTSESSASSITSFSSTSTTTVSSSTTTATTASSGGSDTNPGGGGSPFDNIGNAGCLSKAFQPYFLAISFFFMFLVLH